jgi:hypothetical protein
VSAPQTEKPSDDGFSVCWQRTRFKRRDLMVISGRGLFA